MASTQLADIYNPLVFNEAVDEAALELNRFIRSGIMVPSPVLDQMATVGGNIGELPFHKPLDVSGEPNYSTDDPTSFSTPDKITTGKMIYRLASLNKSWSTMDLTRELALMDPLAAITRKVGGYWATMIEKRLLASAAGILADNDANDSDDMFVSIYSDVVVGSLTAANYISAEAVLDAAQTMGDHKDALAAIAMHSVTFTKLQKLNLIDYIPDSIGVVRIPTYLGYEVIVDDSMTVTAGTNTPRYTTILFARGAFDNGSGKIMVPSELERIPSAGDGGGQDVIYTRRSEIIHPYGFQFTSADVTDNGQSASIAELGAAANWDRVVARKKVGIAFLLHN